MKKITSLFSIVALVFLVGCSSLSPRTINAIATTAKIASKDVVIISLQQHPEWRAGIEQAEGELGVLANAEKIDLRTVVSIIQRLPIKELRGQTALLVAGDVTIIIEDLTTNQATIVTAEDYANIRQVVIGLRDGIRIGLDSSQK